MSLSVGTRIGPYEVTGVLGAGGMGEVYRARDSRLDREVAIKVLPESLANDASRRERFEREAKAVAALSHPNIINIFDTGLHDGHPYVVMELLEGETLRDRLRPKRVAERSDADRTGVGLQSQPEAEALPVRKAIEIAVQIARGLGAAHDKQIVHRDLKPENLIILRDGRVKILDFGLARDFAGSSGATETRAAITDAGMAMGTVGYMAPEQIRAQSVDGRTDLFAFGAVLFEMLSGTRAFQRETPAETMTAILKDEVPDLIATNVQIPPSLERIVRHCLEKHPAERFQSARDVAFALDTLTDTGATRSSGAAPTATSRSIAWKTPALVAVVAVAAAAAGLAYGWGGRPAHRPIAFDAKTWDGRLITNARFGPDGQTIYFSAVGSDNRPSLFTIAPGNLTAKALGEPGTHLLSVSSKGELAVVTGAAVNHHRIYRGTLSRMTLDGASQPWLEGVTEADYSSDGSALAIIRNVNGRDQLEYPIGTVLYAATTGYVSDPRVSPDGTSVAFMDHPTEYDDRGTVRLVNTAKQVTTLTPEYWGEEGIAWSRDNRTVYFSPMQSNAQFEVMAVEASGTRPPIQVMALPSAGNLLDLAPDGRALVMHGQSTIAIRALLPGERVERTFQWLDYSQGAYVSRDGRQIVFSDLSASAGTDYAVARRDVATDRVVRLGPGFALGLSPDGRWVAAAVPSSQQLVLYPTGAGDARRLAGPKMSFSFRDNVDWFADQKRIMFCGREAANPSRCYVQSIDGGDRKIVTPDDVVEAILGPDDRTLVIKRTSGIFQTLVIGGNGPVDLKGFRAEESLLGFTPNGTSVIVVYGRDLPRAIDRVDLATGKRVHLADIGTDVAGLAGPGNVQWLADGSGYTYDFVRTRGQLLVVTGVGK